MIGILIDPEYTLKTFSNKDINITRKNMLNTQWFVDVVWKLQKNTEETCQIACQKFSEIKCQILKNNIKRMSLKNVFLFFVHSAYIHTFQNYKSDISHLPVVSLPLCLPFVVFNGGSQGLMVVLPLRQNLGHVHLTTGRHTGKRMENEKCHVYGW